MSFVKHFVQYGLSAGVVGATGAFFAPSSAAAAGGILKVAGACAVGAPIAALPGAIGMTAALSIMSLGYTFNNDFLKGLGAAFAAIDIAATVLLSAKIGGAIMGVAATPVLTCYLVGIAAAFLAAALLALPIIAAGAAVMEGLAPGSLTR